MSGIVDRTGQRFGRLVVVKLAAPRIHPNGQKATRWLCHCDCGQETVAAAGNLTAGHTQSCGCLAREVNRAARLTHGRSNTPEYRIWRGMLNRGRNPKVASYALYGGRGVAVVERWHSFSAFLADMGTRPTPRHSLDRIDNDRDYSPENCRWATPEQQARNTRRNTWVTFQGERMTLADAAERSGITQSVVTARRKRGWPEQDWFLPVGARGLGQFPPGSNGRTPAGWCPQ